MSVQLDPIIAEKLKTFARRRNLIILRGICTAIVTLLGVFSTMPLPTISPKPACPTSCGPPCPTQDTPSSFSPFGDLRQASVGVAQSQKTRPLDRANRAGTQGRSSSAVELAREEGVESDSEIFRKLVQKDAFFSSQDARHDKHPALGSIAKWLIATAGLIALTLILLYNPNFGGKFQRAIGRALMPGANIAAVTDVEVTILAPGENVTVTPKSEPLRFLIAVTAKEKDQSFDSVEFETRIAGKKQKPVGMARRKGDQFSIDHNVEREKFEYRILRRFPRNHEHRFKTAQWIEMDEPPALTTSTKTYHYPEYTKLKSVTVTEDRETWEVGKERKSIWFLRSTNRFPPA